MSPAGRPAAILLPHGFHALSYRSHMATQGASVENFHDLVFFIDMLFPSGAVDCVEYALLGWWAQQCSWRHHAHNWRSGLPHSIHLLLLIPPEQAQETLC